MNKGSITILVILSTAILIVGLMRFMPLAWVGIDFNNKNFGATSTIPGTTLLSDLDDILTIVNQSKMEMSTTSVASITTLSGLTTIGTITTGTWTATPIGIAYGGTGTTSPSVYMVMLGNGALGLTMASTTGTAGQFLTSNGAGSYPSWQSSSVTETDPYNFTGTYFGVKNFYASSTVANPIYLNTIDYNFPLSETASSTVLMTDGSGSLTWNYPSWRLLLATTTTANLTRATTTFAAVDFIRVEVYKAGDSGQQFGVNFNNDGSVDGLNYGFYGQNMVDATNYFVNGNQYLVMEPVATTSPAYYTIDISNIVAKRKLVTWTASYSTAGTAISGSIVGSGVWNNTTERITTIVFRGLNTGTITSGTEIRIWGK